jgi:DNA-binding MarR family transcriptional regulator
MNDPVVSLMSGLEGIVLIYDQLHRQPARAGNLTAEQRYALRAASLPGGLQMRVLRKKTGYPKGSLSRLTAKLEKDGLLQKNIDNMNGWCRVLRATARGKEALLGLDRTAFKIFKSKNRNWSAVLVNC